MRNTFIKTLTELAAQDSRIVLIVGDLGYGVIEDFQKRFPKQFLNVGVAEQNMTGIAAGLALNGRIVFTYSIGNFPTLRCLEQIRNDICYHNLNVNVVTVGGGFAYGALGSTHHATEDLAIMRALPNMTVIAPGDPVETDLAVRAITQQPGPCYLRLNRSNDAVVHVKKPDFQIGRGIVVKDGTDITLLSTGGMLPTVCKVTELLTAQGISARVVSMHTIKPLDTDILKNASLETKALVTVEEHTIIGGLGSAVAEVLMEMAFPKPLFCRIGIHDTFATAIGSQEYLRNHHEFSASHIVQQVQHLLAPTFAHKML